MAKIDRLPDVVVVVTTYVVSLDFGAAWDLKRDAEVIAACGGDLMLAMSLFEDQELGAVL